MFINLGKNAEVFEFSHKTIPFATGVGYRNYVVFSMWLTWMSDIEAPMERNH